MVDREAYDLETIYDAEIYPLMEQIIAICRRVKMPCLASFAYAAEGGEDGNEDYSTTYLPFESRTPVRYKAAARMIWQEASCRVPAPPATGKE